MSIGDSARELGDASLFDVPGELGITLAEAGDAAGQLEDASLFELLSYVKLNGV